jgi:hypothetical protein
MMKTLLEEIRRKSLPQEFTDAGFSLNSRFVPILQNNFQLHPAVNDKCKQDHIFSTVSFIDGGIAEIIKSADFGFYTIRIADLRLDYTKAKKSIAQKRIQIRQYYCLISINDDTFEVRLQPDAAMQALNISIKDAAVTDNSEPNLDKAANLIRRLLELKAVEDSESVLVVLDGSLDEKHPLETKLMQRIKDKKNTCCALAKTTQLLTDRGNPVTLVLSALQKGAWLYSIPNTRTSFAKFLPNTDFVFRLDTMHQELRSDSTNFVFNYLQSISFDPVFLGYPYYLIEVDRIARISNQEKQQLMTRVKALLGKDWKHIRRRQSSTIAHSILDHISF